MEDYYVAATAGSGSSDRTASSGGSASSWLETSIRRRRLASPSLRSFLAPAFNAAAGPASPGSVVDLDVSLLRYTRPRLRFPSSDTSNSSPADSAESGPPARRRLHQLLRSTLSSPLSPVENAPPRSPTATAYKLVPVKVEVEEDVLVMDGVLVRDSAGATRSRSSSSVSELVGSSVSSAASVSSGKSFYKTEMCRSWEESGVCRYGSECQFAHGKEELRGTRPMKQKSEVGGQGGKSAFTAGPGVYWSRLRHLPTSPKAPAAPPRSVVAAPVPGATTKASLRSPVAVPVPGGTIISPPDAFPRTLPAPIMEEKFLDEAASPPPLPEQPLFLWPPTEEEDACITQVLYGLSRRRRLPVFVEICPE